MHMAGCPAMYDLGGIDVFWRAENDFEDKVHI